LPPFSRSRDLRERDVVGVRAFVISPAQMHRNASGLVQKDQIFDADRHSVPEHRLGVLKRRIGDNSRSERRSATF
jgi:hypothetical protein